MLERTGYLDSARGRAHDGGRGRIENLEELVGVAARVHGGSQEPSLSSFLQEISLYSDQDALRGEEEGGAAR